MFGNIRREKLFREVSSKQVGWYVALDCEMVGTGVHGVQSTLARVSMVDWDGHVILDTFVKVPVSVTDYRTHISGVTQQHLESEQAMDLEDVRYIVQKILQGRVLIGHGLDNDLSALMISHPAHNIRDTACYIPYMQVNAAETSIAGRKLSPRKLKDLVKDFLGWNIQEAGAAHSSVEDALAALALYKKARPEWEAFISRKLREERRKLNQARKVSNAPSRKRQIAPSFGNQYTVSNSRNSMKNQTRSQWPGHEDFQLSLQPAMMNPPYANMNEYI
jgi:RNA exonuclease 4